MRNPTKVIFLSITIILNFMLLSVGIVLAYSLIFPAPAELENRSHYRLTPSAIGEFNNLIANTSIDDNQKHQKVFAWMQNNHLIYTALFDQGGNILFRNYHPGQINKQQLEQIKDHLEASRQSNNKENRKWQQWFIEIIPVVFDPQDRTKNMTLHTVKLKAEVKTGLYQKWLLIAKNALNMVFGGASWLIALSLCLIGGLLVISSGRELNRILKSKQMTENQNLHIEIDSTIDAGTTYTTNNHDTFVAQNELIPDDEQSVASNSPGTDTYQMEFEQERWNLPGFMSVLNPLHKNFYPDEPESWQQYFRAPVRTDKKAHPVNHFAFELYKYKNTPEFPTHLMGLESFARIFLQTMLDIVPGSQITLYLKNLRGQLEPVLLKKGNLFVSGDAIDHKKFSPEILAQLGKKCYVMQNDGKEIYFPLPTRKTMSGVVICESSQALYNRELLSRIWFEIRKFGESLFQIMVFEQATLDPGSGLGNGMLFYRDLQSSFHLKKELIHKRQLTLIRFIHSFSAEQMHWIGLSLRSHFHAMIGIYRISEDACALIGPQLSDDVFARRIAQFLEFVRNYHPCDLCIGVALLENELSSPDEWFRNAAHALEQSTKSGLNRYKYYKSNHDSYEFSQARS